MLPVIEMYCLKGSGYLEFKLIISACLLLLLFQVFWVLSVLTYLESDSLGAHDVLSCTKGLVKLGSCI